NVRSASLPTTGTLTWAGTAVVIDGIHNVIPVSAIDGGGLQFTPAANANGTANSQFTFQVQDDGGNSLPNFDTDPTPNTITVNVTAVNDPPTGANGPINALEDHDYTFATTDFGFSDPLDAKPPSTNSSDPNS